jgi:glycosyltransferase involved in cell wall biosynthesis
MKNNYFIYYNKNVFLQTAPTANEKVLNCKNKIIWDYVLLPAAINKDKIDVMLFTKNVLPFFVKCKSVIVNYDLGYFVKGLNAYKLYDRLYMKLMISSSTKRADAIIAISEHTKKDLIQFTKATENKIKIIYLAADNKYKVINEKSTLHSVSRKYGLDFPFIYYCGSLSPRKNIARLVKAFDLIKHKIPHKMVLTADKSWSDKQIYKLITDLRLDDRIIKLGHVESKDMPAIYNLADLYVYPSLYEGFGLPILEAMSCGCPVISSKATSLPEVAAEAAFMVDSRNVYQLSEAIYTVLTDTQLRKKLVKKGFERIQEFTMQKTACQTLKVLHETFTTGKTGCRKCELE